MRTVPVARSSQRHSPERLIFFSDAVIAIAMTLLILPLMESVYEAGDLTAGQWLAGHTGPLLSFAVSFVVIAGMWRLHHGAFATIVSISSRLTKVNLAWLATIVFLPVPTALLNATAPDRLRYVLYLGTMLLSGVLLALLNGLAAADPGISADPRVARQHLAGALAMIACLVVALVLAAFTSLGPLSLIVLVPIPLLQRLIARMLHAS